MVNFNCWIIANIIAFTYLERVPCIVRFVIWFTILVHLLVSICVTLSNFNFVFVLFFSFVWYSQSRGYHTGGFMRSFLIVNKRWYTKYKRWMSVKDHKAHQYTWKKQKRMFIALVVVTVFDVTLLLGNHVASNIIYLLSSSQEFIHLCCFSHTNTYECFLSTKICLANILRIYAYRTCNDLIQR